jgi:hypothetical protein
MAAARMQRWALNLAAYQFDIRFRKGVENSDADALSRLPVTTLHTSARDYSVNFFALENKIPLKVNKIQKETRKEVVLQKC